MQLLLQGLVVLWFHTSSSGIFYLALLLVTLGKAGRSPTLKAFLSDQFEPNQDFEMAEARSQFWWRAAWFIGAIIPTIISTGLSSKKIIMILAIITVAAYLFFLLGISFYNKEPPRSNITLQMNNWMSLLKLIPLWMIFLIYSVVEAAGTTFFIEQSDNLEDHIGNGFKIPLSFFFVLKSITSVIISYLVDFLTSIWWNEVNQQQRARIVRIAIGMLVSFLCCITAWQVEVHRLKLIKEIIIFSDYQDRRISMSILWLTPQFVLLGLMDGLVEEGLQGFFYDHVPESMKIYELPFNKCVMGIGKFFSIITFFIFFSRWFGNASNTSHLDRYFLVLAIISLAAAAFFSIAVHSFDWKIAQDEDMVDSIMEEGLAQGIPSSSASLGTGNESALRMVSHIDEPPIEQEILHPQPQSVPEHLTQQSSTQTTSELANFFSSDSQADSMATRNWKNVRKSLRTLRFRSLSGGSRPSHD
ncbi:hypothetical protein REPUB_Repub16aG0005500 [Reevesia pubescens]